MAKTACTTAGNFKFCNFLPLNPGKSGNDHLGDSLTGLDGKRLCAMVYHDDTDLATIIRVNRPGRIYQRYAVLEGKAASWPYLRLKTIGESQCDTGRHKGATPGKQDNILRKIRIKIHAGRM
jgi:hypothetical protein